MAQQFSFNKFNMQTSPQLQNDLFENVLGICHDCRLIVLEQLDCKLDLPQSVYVCVFFSSSSLLIILFYVTFFSYRFLYTCPTCITKMRSNTDHSTIIMIFVFVANQRFIHIHECAHLFNIKNMDFAMHLMVITKVQP